MSSLDRGRDGEMELPDLQADARVGEAIARALAEDVGDGDVTTLALVDPEAVAVGEIECREGCRVAGGAVAAAVLKAVDPEIEVKMEVADGRDAVAGTSLLTFSGRAGSILTAERTALNFMQRMCGIATLTAKFARAVEPWGTMILDTRKTTPGMRVFEKYSVLCGGGTNHRFGLFDRVLMKDNHRRLWRGGDPNRLDQAVAAARERFPGVVVEVEVESIAELESALRGKPEWIMLDNMSCELMAECVAITNGAALLEASGGITLERAAAVAATGVDAISLGCLTHSAVAIDLALEWRVA